jgi:hypothetical protein
MTQVVNVINRKLLDYIFDALPRSIRRWGNSNLRKTFIPWGCIHEAWRKPTTVTTVAAVYSTIESTNVSGERAESRRKDLNAVKLTNFHRSPHGNANFANTMTKPVIHVVTRVWAPPPPSCLRGGVIKFFFYLFIYCKFTIYSIVYNKSNK